jgi:hypothetical protein
MIQNIKKYYQKIYIKLKSREIKEENITIKEQLEYLFKKDPYYIYEDYKKKEIQKYLKK